MTTSICTVPIRVSKNNRDIDPAEDERQGIVQNITKQAYWHVSSCKPGRKIIDLILLFLSFSNDQFQVTVLINYSMIISKLIGNRMVLNHI